MANRLRWSALGCVVAVAAVVLIFAGRVMTKIYRVSTGGMAPIIGINDRVMTWRTHNPARGDIIALAYPLHPETTFVKRVVGMPGDVVEIRDKTLIVDGKTVDEPYVLHDDPQLYPRDPALPEPYRSRDQYGPYRIAPDTFFVLGDNRDRSADSRYWGTVPRKNVLGLVTLIWSAKRGLVVP